MVRPLKHDFTSNLFVWASKDFRGRAISPYPNLYLFLSFLSRRLYLLSSRRLPLFFSFPPSRYWLPARHFVSITASRGQGRYSIVLAHTLYPLYFNLLEMRLARYQIEPYISDACTSEVTSSIRVKRPTIK